MTGAAGFIGSHLVEALLGLEQEVVGLDNFATGHAENLDAVRSLVGEEPARRLSFIEGDIRDRAACARAAEGVDVVLHQAALGSVPRSIADPWTTHEVNVDGFVNVLLAARDAGVKRFVYASSSSVYGDEETLPKVEERVGRPLSPYAATKAANEVYAHAFANAYGLELVGLRYFNVFGPRQDPEGPYAAVIPRWLQALSTEGRVVVFGDGETSRDFCYVANAVQANLLAGVASRDAVGHVYNVAVGARTSLTELFERMRGALAARRPEAAAAEARHEGFRPGDVRHSLADVSKAQRLLGYEPTHDLERGLAETVRAFLEARS